MRGCISSGPMEQNGLLALSRRNISSLVKWRSGMGVWTWRETSLSEFMNAVSWTEAKNSRKSSATSMGSVEGVPFLSFRVLAEGLLVLRCRICLKSTFLLQCERWRSCVRLFRLNWRIGYLHLFLILRKLTPSASDPVILHFAKSWLRESSWRRIRLGSLLDERRLRLVRGT